MRPGRCLNVTASNPGSSKPIVRAPGVGSTPSVRSSSLSASHRRIYSARHCPWSSPVGTAAARLMPAAIAAPATRTRTWERFEMACAHYRSVNPRVHNQYRIGFHANVAMFTCSTVSLRARARLPSKAAIRDGKLDIAASARTFMRQRR